MTEEKLKYVHNFTKEYQEIWCPTCWNVFCLSCPRLSSINMHHTLIRQSPKNTRSRCTCTRNTLQIPPHRPRLEAVLRTAKWDEQKNYLTGTEKEECGPALSPWLTENTAAREEEEVCDNRWMSGMRKRFYIEERKNDLVRRGLTETGSSRGTADWLFTFILYTCMTVVFFTSWAFFVYSISYWCNLYMCIYFWM